jgi:excisionase family DNA binding protein
MKPLAQCERCGHFATVHHGGHGGRPGGGPCTNPDGNGGNCNCNCTRFDEGSNARAPIDKDLLTPAELANVVGLSVHTLSYWRWNGKLGPKSIKLGERVFYRRGDVEGWLAEIDGQADHLASQGIKNTITKANAVNWYEKAVQAANQIDPQHTSPWKLASAYALLAIAENLTSRTTSAPRQSDGELLTIAEVAELTRLSPATLRYWRSTGHVQAPKSFRLGRRVMYRRADVEKWVEEAHQ